MATSNFNLQYAVDKFRDLSLITGPNSQYYRFESEYDQKDYHIWDSFVSYIESNSIDSLETAQRIIEYPIDALLYDFLFYKEPFLDFLRDHDEDLET